MSIQSRCGVSLTGRCDPLPWQTTTCLAKSEASSEERLLLWQRWRGECKSARERRGYVGVGFRCDLAIAGAEGDARMGVSQRMRIDASCPSTKIGA